VTDQLPIGLLHVRTTETFDHEHHPVGLRRAHRVADGVWARLVVHSGELGFSFEDKPDRTLVIAGGSSIVIPPGRLHHVDITSPVTFALEFHRIPDHSPPARGSESSGLDAS
jgi:tellurite resistance-related uncharacterized protein